MKFMRQSGAAVVVTVLAITSSTTLVHAQRHPLYDDGGTITWFTTLDAAKEAARKANTLIFMEVGTKTWGRCVALVERVLPHPTVKNRMSALAVGLAVDWYAAGPEVEKLCANLPEPRNAPMVGFVTAEGVWVDGFSGWITEGDFVKVLDRVEKSPLLLATPAVRKQLEKHAVAVGPAVEKAKWQVVLAAAREARKSTGMCPERDAIAAAEKAARDWATGELDAVVQGAKSGADLVPLRKKLRAVKDKFPGEPESEDVDTGMRALQKLALVREVEAAGNPAVDLRERHAEPFKGTRWVSVFDKVMTATGQK